MTRKKIAIVGGAGQIGGIVAMLAIQKELGDVVLLDIADKENLTAMLFAISVLLPMSASSETATYYGKSFNGRRMANGAVYQPHKMVAAHRRYRLGTRLKVINRKNGRSVTVTVSDRCACSLDLSPAAFKRIGNLGQGRVPVKVAVSG